MGIAAALLAAIGMLLIGATGFLLRSVGSAWRVARVLGSTREVPLSAIGEATGRYVKTHGRIGSDEEFPDEHQRPLVFRRTRVQHTASGGQWETLNDDRVAVPFWIEERGDELTIDVDALGDGLVVVPRIAEGVAAELPTSLGMEVPPTLSGEAPVRVRIDQVSAVEHATAAGLVERTPNGHRLTAGMGRPLILTTVAPDAAMRLLASEHRPRVIGAAALGVTGLGFLAAALVAAVFGLRS
jgi:hypothetical protein